MTTDVEIYKRESTIAVREWGDERVALVVSTLMKTPPDKEPPTPAEVDLFAMRCKTTGLDPFSGQIHAIYRNDRKAPLGRALTMQTGIDGFRLIAHRTGEVDGMDDPQWLDRDGTWRDAWIADYPPLAARVRIWRKGASRPFVGEAMYREYVQEYDGRPQGLWARMPANQLRKCAEAQAWRTGFPAELVGIYEDAELDHADAVVPEDVKAERQAEANERADEQRISTADGEAIAALARAARLTRGEVRGILEDVASVGRVEHVRKRDLAAVLAALQARVPPPAKDGAPVVGEPEVEPTTVEVQVEEVVEDEAGTAAPGGDPPPASGEAPERAAPAPATPLEPLDAEPEGFGAQPRDPQAGAMYGPGAPS